MATNSDDNTSRMTLCNLAKKAESLQIEDLKKYPVWKFINDDELGETMVRPVESLPVENLKGRLVGTEIRLACGSIVWVLLANIEVAKPDVNEQLITLSIEQSGRWFRLARYHDPTYKNYGPTALAEFLKRSITDIFPIAYDISRYSKGLHASLVGKINLEPKVRLSRAEIIALTLQRRR